MDNNFVFYDGSEKTAVAVEAAESQTVENHEVLSQPVAVQTVVSQPVKRPSEPKLFDLSIRDTIFAILLFASAVIFSIFGLWGGFRAGFAVSSVINFGVMTAYLCSKSSKIRVYPLFCGILSCALSVPFLVTSNGAVRFWSFVGIVLLSAVWFDSLVNEKPEEGDIGLPKRLFPELANSFGANMPKSLASLFVSKGERKNGVGKVFLGILFALPVLFVVVPLLISSDAAFGGLAELITENISLTISQVIIGMMLAPFVLSYCFSLKKDRAPEETESSFEGLENSIIISFLSVISICYVTYLVSQLAYFFSAFSGFLPEDYSFTVSEYARRGFFEMSAIAAINLIIIFAVLLLSRKKNNKICVASRILCLFIGIFTLVIIATALSKMIMYIDNAGMTRLRLTTSAFMIFLAIVFLSLMLRLFSARVKVIRTALVTAGCVLILLGSFNVNRVAVSYNYESYQRGVLDSIDVKAIADLGDEGVPYLVKLAEDTDAMVSKDAEYYLKQAIINDYYEFDYENGKYVIAGKLYDDIGEYSISRNAAYKALDGYIKENPEMSSFNSYDFY